MLIHSNKILKESLNPGDHIYSWRNGYIYAHHGIYVGEDRVLHFTRGGGQEVGTGTFLDRFIFTSSSPNNSGEPCPECGDNSNANGVIKSCLECFLSGGELHLFLYSVTRTFFLTQTRGGTCTLAKSDPPEEVLHRASYLHENGFGEYNLYRNNCEDFALYCKTEMLIAASAGFGRSGQVSAYVAMALGWVVPGPGIMVFNLSRLWNDTGFRSDVIKLPVEKLVDGLRSTVGADGEAGVVLVLGS